MKIALIILLLFAALIFILLLMPLRIYVTYRRDDSENRAELRLKYLFLNLTLFDSSVKKPKKEKKEKNEPSFDEEKKKISDYIKIFDGIKSDLAEVLEYLSSRAAVVELICLDTEFGFSDAMQTGIFTGVINGFVYSVLGFIHHHSRLLDMKVNIQPNFENPCFRIDTKCILRLKNVHIIIVAFKVLRILRKIKKL